jgi:hypothetical protein
MLNKKDTSVIPQGYYCYTWVEKPNRDTGFNGKIKTCPYLTKKEFNGVEVPWCNFLNCGGLDNNHDETDIPKLIEHFGSEEKMDEELPLFLLWDMVKECGVNEPED